MAIDTAAKRASVISFASSTFPDRRPSNGISTAAARGNIVFTSASISAGAPVVSTGTTKTEKFWFFFRRRR